METRETLQWRVDNIRSLMNQGDFKTVLERAGEFIEAVNSRNNLSSDIDNDFIDHIDGQVLDIMNELQELKKRLL
jgi:hypothetical protein